jgi:hypothetical protein
MARAVLISSLIKLWCAEKAAELVRVSPAAHRGGK